MGRNINPYPPEEWVESDEELLQMSKHTPGPWEITFFEKVKTENKKVK